MDAFEFSTASKILFGADKAELLPNLAFEQGLERCFVLTGRTPERVSSILEPLSKSGIKLTQFKVPGEPSVDLIRQATGVAQAAGCHGLIAVGGGSVLDAGKAVAALLANEGDVSEYLEIIGKGRKIEQRSAPLIAVPTTSGTGAEVTRNAVLFSSQHRVKVSLRSPLMTPTVALVDPKLTLLLPREQTLESGMDALTQLIEAYVSCRSSPITDGFCVQGLPRISRSLERACVNGEDLAARTDMSLGSMLSGLALANAGLGVIHGFAGPLGGMFAAPHGAICAALLPHGMAGNLKHLRKHEAFDSHASDSIRRYEDIAQWLTGRTKVTPEEGIEWIQDLNRRLGVRPLTRFGMGSEHTEEVVDKAQRASSMKANPVTLSPPELSEIYQKAL